MSHITYRVSGIPDNWSRPDLREELANEFKVGVHILSFALDLWQKGSFRKVAIVAFKGAVEKLKPNPTPGWSPKIRSARTGDEGIVIDLDTDFNDFTPISDVETEKSHVIE